MTIASVYLHHRQSLRNEGTSRRHPHRHRRPRPHRKLHPLRRRRRRAVLLGCQLVLLPPLLQVTTRRASPHLHAPGAGGLFALLQLPSREGDIRHVPPATVRQWSPVVLVRFLKAIRVVAPVGQSRVAPLASFAVGIGVPAEENRCPAICRAGAPRGNVPWGSGPGVRFRVLFLSEIHATYNSSHHFFVPIPTYLI